MFKIGNYIFVEVPKESFNYELGLPYNNYLWYETGKLIKCNTYNWLKNKINLSEDTIKMKGFEKFVRERKAIAIPYLKPNTGIRYKIQRKVFNHIIIKINGK